MTAIIGYCETCGEPLRLTPFGLAGSGGVCRHPLNPNDDDEGQHVLVGVDSGSDRDQAGAA